MKSPRARQSRRRGGDRPNESISPISAGQGAFEALQRWRAESRVPALKQFARRTASLKWTRALFLLVLEELSIGDEFDEILGNPEKISPARYPQAVAMAIALRYSWRPDYLAEVASQLVSARPPIRSGERGLHSRPRTRWHGK